MSSHRPYRPALDMVTTKHEIISKKSKVYCPECVEACIELIEESGNDTRRLFLSLAKESEEAVRGRNSVWQIYDHQHQLFDKAIIEKGCFLNATIQFTELNSTLSITDFSN